MHFADGLNTEERNMAAKRRKKRARKRKHAKRKVTHRKRARARHVKRHVKRQVKRRKHKRAKRKAVSHGTWTCRNCRCLCVNRSKCWLCGCAKSVCAA